MARQSSTQLSAFANESMDGVLLKKRKKKKNSHTCAQWRINVQVWADLRNFVAFCYPQIMWLSRVLYNVLEYRRNFALSVSCTISNYIAIIWKLGTYCEWLRGNSLNFFVIRWYYYIEISLLRDVRGIFHSYPFISCYPWYFCT